MGPALLAAERDVAAAAASSSSRGAGAAGAPSGGTGDGCGAGAEAGGAAAKAAASGAGTYVGPNASVRDYCCQEISPELNVAVASLLTQLKGYQDRAAAKAGQGQVGTEG
jgi:hypothetical protein